MELPTITPLPDSEGADLKALETEFLSWPPLVKAVTGGGIRRGELFVIGGSLTGGRSAGMKKAFESQYGTTTPSTAAKP